jgi:signal transduction histidine kinase/CheY-like chemotaxis protein
LNELANVLRDKKEQIVARFVRETQRKREALQVPRSLVVDHIPRFLDELRADLARVSGKQAVREDSSTAKAAREHGEQRWRLGYDLQTMVGEYRILAGCILDAAKEDVAHLAIADFEVLTDYVGAAVDQATAAYTKHRDEEVNAEKAHLEFLAQAGQLLSSSLDYRSTLHRLTGLLVPRMADWCAVHFEGTGVDEVPIAHVDPTKVELLREAYRHYPLGGSPRGFQRVIRTREPLFVPEVEPDFYERSAVSSRQLEILRAIHTTSWIIVPLAVQDQAFGALTMAFSESPRRYTERDLVVAGDVARRAAVAIDNARVYELSQNERSRVEAATRAKDEFVAMVSHELRTPLNAILGWLGLMRTGTLSDDKRAHALDVIERNAKSQSRLVGDLLDISRALTGTIRISPSQVDFSNVVDMVIEGMRPAADAKRIQLQVNVDRDSTVMRGDGDRLQQVVWNVLANAVKFTPKGGLVSVVVRRIESDLEFTVQDSGPGISPKFLPHVFESFRQSDGSTTRAHGGLGIGLSIAKHIVDLHGGTMEARSEGEGCGATFIVRLPISPLVSSTAGIVRAAATQERAADFGLPVASEPTRVLVVDDEPDARELLACLFDASGIESRLAGSAAEAFDVLERFVPDVIITDIGMPGEDGYAFIRRVRTLPDKRRTIPAIALTAFSRNEDRKRALVDGFNAHMAKPVEPAKLVSAVLELARARARPTS